MMTFGLIAYIRCVFTDPGVSVPLSEDEEYELSLRLRHRELSFPFVKLFSDVCGRLLDDAFTSVELLNLRDEYVSYLE